MGFADWLPSHRRRTWAGAGRASVEVRGLDGPSAAAIAEHVERAVRGVPGVDWASVVPALGRVVVGFEQDQVVDVVGLVRVVEEVEHGTGATEEPFAERPDHPADREPLVWEGLAVVADVGAFGLAVAGRLTHLARLPMEVAGLVPAVQSQPRVRQAAQRVIGAVPTDAALAVANAVAQGLAQGPLGLAIDLGQRLAVLGELSARRRLWEDWATRLAPVAGTPPPDVGPRPVPMPPGPVEVHADRIGVASVSALAAGSLASRSLRRGMATMLAFTPKAATTGRESFAARLDRHLAGLGVLCLDTSVLRRLDRLDAVVIDSRLMGDPDPLVECARAAGLRVLLTGLDREVALRAGVDDWIDGSTSLHTHIRRLQEDGAAVAAVTGDAAGLVAADCGIGVTADGEVPWEADILCRDAGQVCFVLDAVAVAREVSDQSATVSLAAAGVGAALSVLSPLARAARNANGVVNTGAALAMANGVRAAAGLARRPLRVLQHPPAWHELELGDVYAGLATTAGGLSSEAAAERRRPPSLDDDVVSFPAAVVEELTNPMTPVLAGAAAISGAAGSLADAGLVGTVLAANGMLGGLQRHRVERAVHDLEQASKAPVWTRRDGRWSTRPPDDLVVGDVIRLQSGDWVPADCRVLSARALEVEQASLTGESAPVPKGPEPAPAQALDERSSMLYEGSVIAAGRARAVVVTTAPGTELRRAARGVTAPSSGVESRVRELTSITIPAALAGGAALLASSLLRGTPVRRSAESGVTLAVAAVPEGLPLLATMAQLAAARRLSARGVLVRNPRSLEALGRVEVLCCDKTGTLTEGRIRVHAVHDGTRLQGLDDLAATHRAVLVGAVRASPAARSDGQELPHLTDRAIVEGAARCGLTTDTGLDGWSKAAELPFEPARGYHAVLAHVGDAQVVSVKGAPEVVLPRCATWRTRTGRRPLDERTRQRLTHTVERLGHRGYRVLAVGERRTSRRDGLDDSGVDELDLLGFVALIDPVRPAGAQAVARLQQAGISIVVLTGDHRSTAEGVAVELGVLNGRRVLTGPELDRLSDAQLDAILDDVGIFARVTPTHKTRLVSAYQRRGQAVAMTGDGANDAPAIRLADAGVAFGPHATPAARGAADVVVPDGRIETLVDAIVEGRALWAAVRDAIAILVGGNLGEIAFTVLGSALTPRPPLNPRQLLLVNLLTDIAPAIVVATRPPKVAPDQLLAEGPSTSLGRPLERAIASRAVSTTAGASAAFVGARLTGHRARAGTVALVGLVGAQLGQTVRSDPRNPTVVAASLGSAAVLAGIVQTPGVSHFFGCRPLGPLGWGIGLTSAAAATVTAGSSDRLIAGLPGLRDTGATDAGGAVRPGDPTRAELYELARQLDIRGRSRMRKRELHHAVAEHARAASGFGGG